MREFFLGWKRKVGVVMLVMALIAMGGWLRGQSYWDYFFISSHSGNNGGSLHFHSSRQGLTWGKVEHFIDATTYSASSFRVFRDTQPIDQLVLSHMEMMDGPETIDWRWKWGGFDFGKWEGAQEINVSYWSVPYYSIVVPLTLLSAFLLLSKTRPSTPIKITEPTPGRGA